MFQRLSCFPLKAMDPGAPRGDDEQLSCCSSATQEQQITRFEKAPLELAMSEPPSSALHVLKDSQSNPTRRRVCQQLAAAIYGGHHHGSPKWFKLMISSTYELLEKDDFARLMMTGKWAKRFGEVWPSDAKRGKRDGWVSGYMTPRQVVCNT